VWHGTQGCCRLCYSQPGLWILRQAAAVGRTACLMAAAAAAAAAAAVFLLLLPGGRAVWAMRDKQSDEGLRRLRTLCVMLSNVWPAAGGDVTGGGWCPASGKYSDHGAMYRSSLGPALGLIAHDTGFKYVTSHSSAVNMCAHHASWIWRRCHPAEPSRPRVRCWARAGRPKSIRRPQF
jgi:hypothetical protein